MERSTDQASTPKTLYMPFTAKAPSLTEHTRQEPIVASFALPSEVHASTDQATTDQTVADRLVPSMSSTSQAKQRALFVKRTHVL